MSQMSACVLACISFGRYVLILEEMSLLSMHAHKGKAMMGISIYWISRHSLFGKRFLESSLCH